MNLVAAVGTVVVCAAFLASEVGCDVPPPNSSGSTDGGNVAEVTDVTALGGVISGALRNVTDTCDLAFEIKFTTYDHQGSKLGTAIARIDSLRPGETWRFKANVWDSDCASYRFLGVWTKYGQVKTSYTSRKEIEVSAHRAADAGSQADREADARRKEAAEQQERENAQRIAEAQAAAIQIEKAKTLAHVIEFQQQRASNGSPSFQLELGRRYLNGDGVETNLALAIQWFRAACTNRHPDASNELRKLGVP